MSGSDELIIRHATVITLDKDRRIILDGSVAISAGKITKVGEAADLEAYKAEEELDGRGRIVLPGLINPHCHLGYSLGKGCGDDLPFVKWLPVQSRIQDGYTDEEWRVAALLSMAEMIKSGTTCFGDTNGLHQMGVLVAALEESGMRGVIGKSIVDVEPAEQDKVPWVKRKLDTERLSLAAAVEDYGSWHGKAGGRATVCFSPRVWPACSSRGYKEVARKSREMGVRNLIHHTEAQEWRAVVKEFYGKEPTLMLQDFGILGPETLLENSSSFTDEEVEVMAATKTNFNYLPTANMKNYLGVVDITALVERGVNVSIGTSGGLINNVNDMFREMKTLALQQRMLKMKPDAISPETILEIATIGGARCLGLGGEVGSLEECKRADLIILNANQPHLVPVLDPVSAVVYCANGGDVETSIIDGKVVMAKRRLLTLDEDSLLEKAKEIAPRALRRIGVLG